MRIISKKSILILVLLFSWSCKKDIFKKQTPTSLPYFNNSDFTPEWNKPIHKIPSFSFVNQDGKKTDNKFFEGKIYIADFFFTTCPGICLKLTSNMYKLQQNYQNDDDVLLLSHSVMPWVDDVKKLKEYALLNLIDSSKWNLVTGEKDEIYEIARNGYFADNLYSKSSNADQFIHTEKFILIDKKGYIRGVYNGTIPLDVNRLIRHIDVLKKEI